MCSSLDKGLRVWLGKCSRGSEMEKASSAFCGNEDGFVTPSRDVQVASGLPVDGVPSVVNGCSAAIKASMAPGPVTSMLPISNRRSSTITGGFCLFDISSSSFHSCKNADGCTRIKTFLRSFFPFFVFVSSTSTISTSFDFSSAAQTNVTGAVGRLYPSSPLRSNTHVCKLLVPALHFLPFLPQASSPSTPTPLNTLSTPSTVPSICTVDI